MRTHTHARVLAGALVLAFAAPAAADQTFNILSPPMYHQYGVASGALWSYYYPTNGSSGVFSTYGPYLRLGPDEGEIIAMTYLEFIPDVETWLNADWDIYDGATQLYKQRYSVYHSQHDITALAAFRTQPNDIQVRTRHLGGGRINQGNVRLLWESADKVSQFWPAIEQMFDHSQGKAIDAGDWITGPNMPGCSSWCPGYNDISFGPVSGSFVPSPGEYVALYHLQSDGGSGSNTYLFTLKIEYWDDSRNVYMEAANVDVFGVNLRGNNVMTPFPVKFTAPSPLPTKWNFRVIRGHTTITIRQSGTKIYKMN